MTDIEKQKGVYFLLHRSRNFVFVYYSNDIEKQYERMKKKLNKNEFKATTLQECWNEDKEQSFIFIKQYIDDEDILKARTQKWIDWFRNERFECEHLLSRALVKPEWEVYMDRRRKEESLWEVDVDLRAKIYSIRKRLDFTLEFAEDRVELVKQIFQENQQWLRDYVSSIGFINKQVKTKNHVLTEKDMYGIFMTSVVDYLRFPSYKNKKFKNKKIKYDDYILSKYKNDTNERREILVADITEIDEKDIVKTETKIRKREDNFKLIPKQTITEKDRSEYPQLDDYMKFMEYVDAEIKRCQLTNDTTLLRRLGVIKQDLSRDCIDAKDRIRGTIYFRRLSGDSTEYSLDTDTGYFDDKIQNGKLQFGDYKLVSQNKIEFNDPKHIFAIIDNYSSLREACYDTPDSDLWSILYDFDNLVESTPLEPYMKDILIMKIDGISGKEICEEINLSYGMDLTDRNLTQIYKSTIPKIIAESYMNLYDDWFYTYRAKGKYKTCSKCNETKLALDRYFSPDKNRNDGFFPYCKRCR